VGRGTAVRIKFEDGHTEKYKFDEISKLSSQFANALEHLGLNFSDRVAIMLDPSLEFYVSLFGTLKRGAIVVPCFPLFGPEALGVRLKDSGAKLLITTEEKKDLVGNELKVKVITTGPQFLEFLERHSSHYESKTSPKGVRFISDTRVRSGETAWTAGHAQEEKRDGDNNELQVIFRKYSWMLFTLKVPCC
jgi:acyl-CoA synthetase (AMP-forming)/AMP-acid ligase II